MSPRLFSKLLFPLIVITVLLFLVHLTSLTSCEPVFVSTSEIKKMMGMHYSTQKKRQQSTRLGDFAKQLQKWTNYAKVEKWRASVATNSELQLFIAIAAMIKNIPLKHEAEQLAKFHNEMPLDLRDLDINEVKEALPGLAKQLIDVEGAMRKAGIDPAALGGQFTGKRTFDWENDHQSAFPFTLGQTLLVLLLFCLCVLLLAYLFVG